MYYFCDREIVVFLGKDGRLNLPTKIFFSSLKPHETVVKKLLKNEGGGGVRAGEKEGKGWRQRPTQ